MSFSSKFEKAEGIIGGLSADAFKRVASYAEGICGDDVFRLASDTMPGAGKVTTVTHMPAANTKGLREEARIIYSFQDGEQLTKNFMAERQERWLEFNT